MTSVLGSHRKNLVLTRRRELKEHLTLQLEKSCRGAYRRRARPRRRRRCLRGRPRRRRLVLARHPAARVQRILQHGHRDGGGLLWRREVPRRGRRLLQVDFLPRAGHNFMMTLITTLPVVPHRSRPAKIRWLIHSESALNSAGKCATTGAAENLFIYLGSPRRPTAAAPYIVTAGPDRLRRVGAVEGPVPLDEWHEGAPEHQNGSRHE